ncbi:hypothetical protein BGZ73_002361 [Actinomortierella ambigua]|nr:hypothetical protein BGZ73_002361 [Actinomortierella ambigua]
MLKDAGTSIHVRFTTTDGFSRAWNTRPLLPSLQHHLHARQDNSTAGGSTGDATSDSKEDMAAIIGGVITTIFVLGLIVYCIFFRRKRNATLITEILAKYSGQSKSSPSLTPLNDDYYIRPAPISLHSTDYEPEHEREDQEQIALQKMQIEAHSKRNSAVLVSSSLALPLAPPQPSAPMHEIAQHVHDQEQPQYHQQQQQQQQQQPNSTPLQSVQLVSVPISSAGWQSSSSIQDTPVSMLAVPWEQAAGKTVATPVVLVPHYYGAGTPVMMMPQYYGSSSSSVSGSVSSSSGMPISQPAESITLYEMTEKERLRHQAHHQPASLPPIVLEAQDQVEADMANNLPPPPPYLQKVEATLQEPSAPTGFSVGLHHTLSTVMKIALLASAFVLAQVALASPQTFVTLPVAKVRNPAAELNGQALAKRYLAKRAMGTAALTNAANDVLYTVPLAVGTPAQLFHLAIDTGSPVTWVSSDMCFGEACLGVNTFNCQASTTCRTLNGQVFGAKYVSGQSVNGTYTQEMMSLASLSFPGIIGVVTQNSARLPPGVDGIMGLWYYNQGSAIPFLDRMKNATILTNPVMGVYLKPSDHTPQALADGQGGEVTFGGLNPARYTGEITYINNIGPTPWTIPVSGMAVNGQPIPLSNVSAVIDTGTTAFLVPPATSNAVNGAIPGAVQLVGTDDSWLLPCKGTSKISLTFGTFTAEIPYDDLVLEATAQQTSKGLYCYSTVMHPTGATVAVDHWLIGDTFIKNVFSVYDFSDASPLGRIGFAKLAAPDPRAGNGGGAGTGPSSGSGGTSGGSGGSNNNGGVFAPPNTAANGSGGALWWMTVSLACVLATML